MNGRKSCPQRIWHVLECQHRSQGIGGLAERKGKRLSNRPDGLPAPSASLFQRPVTCGVQFDGHSQAGSRLCRQAGGSCPSHVRPGLFPSQLPASHWQRERFCRARQPLPDRFPSAHHSVWSVEYFAGISGGIVIRVVAEVSRDDAIRFLVPGIAEGRDEVDSWAAAPRIHVPMRRGKFGLSSQRWWRRGSTLQSREVRSS